ncbi:MAG TPA: hypothetical protein VLV15_14920 [Dongiaceae bacterium]|nr:hypothetical protein [Dongiaceae bacterium]
MRPARRWVRELSPEEGRESTDLGTGDLLPDGAVVLREADIDRMGLRSLRHWIAAHSLQPHHPIALVRRGVAAHPRDDDDGEALD